MKSENKHQKNLIQWDIRNIFPIINETHSPEKIVEKVHIQQYLEKTEEVYLLNLVTTKGAIDDLHHGAEHQALHLAPAVVGVEDVVLHLGEAQQVRRHLPVDESVPPTGSPSC